MGLFIMGEMTVAAGRGLNLPTPLLYGWAGLFFFQGLGMNPLSGSLIGESMAALAAVIIIGADSVTGQELGILGIRMKSAFFFHGSVADLATQGAVCRTGKTVQINIPGRSGFYRALGRGDSHKASGPAKKNDQKNGPHVNPGGPSSW